MKAQIISIGNELLIGDTVNTNASWLGEILTEQGIEVDYVHTIGDDYDLIQSAVSFGLDNADLILTTGGLGPTHDDITKKAIADLLNVGMKIHEPTLRFIKEMFKKRGLTFSTSNHDQALVPEQAEVLFNKQGTAPGIWMDRQGKKLVVLPGVPFEMKELVLKQVLPKINQLFNGHSKRLTRYILTAGVGESSLSDDLIGSLDVPSNVSVAYLPSPAGTKIRLTAVNKNAENDMAAMADHIYSRASEYIVGEGKDFSLEQAVGELLKDRQYTLACAESCTGGRLADTLTNIPGSSAYMQGGVVAYSNEAKIALLDVDENTIQKFGAVSKQVALQMAKGAAHRFEADVSVSTTGIAGPTGGSKEKPVGTVWIGYWSEHRHFAVKALFTNYRLINKERTVAVALDLIRRSLNNITSMPYDLKPQFA